METAAAATSSSSPIVKAQTADAGTQYTPPGYPPTARWPASTNASSINSDSTLAPSDPAPTITPTSTLTPSKRREPSDENEHPPQPAEPNLRVDPQPHSSLVPTASTVANAPRKGADLSPSKRAKSAGMGKTVLPRDYAQCNVTDLGILISDMLMELVRINDKIPLQDGQLTRFHSRYVMPLYFGLAKFSVSDYVKKWWEDTVCLPDEDGDMFEMHELSWELATPRIHEVELPELELDAVPMHAELTANKFACSAPPGISVKDYLHRLIVHATLSPPVLLSMVYYIDRMCSLYPGFTISSLTVHRFLISAATVAAKGLSDSFWTNNTYARVGGVSTKELALLELFFLEKLQWRIVPQPEVLIEYYQMLVERSENYELAPA